MRASEGGVMYRPVDAVGVFHRCNAWMIEEQEKRVIDVHLLKDKTELSYPSANATSAECTE